MIQRNYVFCSCRFTLPSFFLVFMLFDVLAIGENSNLQNSLSAHHACGALCIPSTCSVTDNTRKYSDMVLQFSGFHRQCTQSITLLYLVRYPTTLLILSPCAYMQRVNLLKIGFALAKKVGFGRWAGFSAGCRAHGSCLGWL